MKYTQRGYNWFRTTLTLNQLFRNMCAYLSRPPIQRSAMDIVQSHRTAGELSSDARRSPRLPVLTMQSPWIVHLVLVALIALVSCMTNGESIDRTLGTIPLECRRPAAQSRRHRRQIGRFGCRYDHAGTDPAGNSRFSPNVEVDGVAAGLFLKCFEHGESYSKTCGL